MSQQAVDRALHLIADMLRQLPSDRMILKSLVDLAGNLAKRCHAAPPDLLLGIANMLPPLLLSSEVRGRILLVCFHTN